MLRRLLRIVLIPLLLFGLGYGAYRMVLFGFDQLLSYDGPVAGPLKPGPAGGSVSERVVVVVVDGLREDTSHEMPTFQSRRERGADLPSWAGLPSLSRPGYTTLGTGAYPEFSAVTTNWTEESVRVDSLLARAREAGLATAVVAMDGWDTLFGDWATSVYTAPWSASGRDPQSMAWTTESIGQEALRVLQEGSAALVYVHFGEVDEAGHAYGGTSPQYLQSALRVDAQIDALAGALDWSRDTLVLTADHGMTAAGSRGGGGHGGGEPECRRVPVVMVGRGIAPGVYPDGGQADVVPTVAALLGLAIPAHSQGRTRLDALVLTPEQRADKALSLGEQQEALYAAYLRALGTPAELDGLGEARSAWAAGQHGQVESLVDAYLGRLDQAVARAAANRLWRDRAVRLPYLLVAPLAAALCVGLYRPRRELVRPLLLALLFFALREGLYWIVRGQTLSLSTIRAEDEQAFFLSQVTDVLIVLAVVSVAAGVVWRCRPWEEVVWGANLSTLVIAWLFLLQIGLYLWLHGLWLTWRLPDMGWGLRNNLDLLALVGVGCGAVLFPWLALGVARSFNLIDWVAGQIRTRRLRKR